MLSHKRIYFKVVVSSLGNKNVNFILKEYILTLFQRHYWSFHLILWSKHERKNFKCSILLKQLIRDIYKLNWSRVEGYRCQAKPSSASRSCVTLNCYSSWHRPFVQICLEVQVADFTIYSWSGAVSIPFCYSSFE